MTLRGDYAAGYRAMRRILALGEARGYQPGTSHARFVFALLACWFGPLESGVHAGQRAREGLIAGGDMANGAYSYHPTVYYLLDCAPSLDACVAEVESGLAFVRRTGNEEAGQWLDSCRRLAGVLRGESAGSADEAVPVDSYADNPLALLHAHLGDAIAAAIFGDLDGLTRHAGAAIPLLPAALGLYPTAVGRLLHGLALAGQARMTSSEERGGLLAELDEVIRWLAVRAAGAPDNFLHLLRWLEAERAWAVGDFRAAVLTFDAALREVAGRQRPWHRALITERAGCFYLAQGVDHTGSDLLAEARHEYAAWGATAKVAELDWAFPALRPPTDATAGRGADPPAGLSGRRSTVTTGTIDLLGILSASQSLSSETSIDRLHTSVAQVLRAMTGATDVQLLLWDEDRQDWLLPVSGSGIGPVSGTGHEPAGPMSVLRYIKRTREPLVVGDVTRDDRFARDPYFADVDCCSLLALPVLSRGALRAVLLLENQLIRGAFTTGRLEAVKLIAGQLGVSLDNAQLYARFRLIAEEQAALRRVATLVAAGAPPEEAFAAVADEAGQLFLVDVANMCRYEPDGTATIVASAGGRSVVGTRLRLEGKNGTTLVYQTGRAARMESYTNASGPLGAEAREGGVRSSVGTPIMVEGRLWGVLGVGTRTEQPLPPDAEARLVSFTELVATAVANAESRAALTRLAEEQAVLRRVATLVARGVPPVQIFSAVSDEVTRLFGAQAVILRFSRDGPAVVFVGVPKSLDIPVGTRWEFRAGMASAEVYRTGGSARVDAMDWSSASGPVAEVARRLGIVSSAGSPIVVEGRLWGAMNVASTDELLPFGMEGRLEKFTGLLGTAIANAESRSELAASRRRIVAASDETRRRIERDLHDGTQQRLVSLALAARTAEADVAAGRGDPRAGLSRIAAGLADAVAELQELSRGIHPAVLSEHGLGPALRTLARRSAVPVDLDITTNARCPEPIEIAAYYVTSEALANTMKHAQASHAEISLSTRNGSLLLSIRDDGVGGADPARGSGLAGLTDRVEALGGSIHLHSTAGAGTHITVDLPLAH